MSFFENITFRRTRTKSDCESKINVEKIHDNFNDTCSSLPNISDDNFDDVQKLQEKIELLNAELSSAHNEIQTLSLENTELKRQNEELQKKNELYKKITNSPISKSKGNTPKKAQTKKCNNKQTQTSTEKSHEPRQRESVEKKYGETKEKPSNANKQIQKQTKKHHQKLAIFSSNNTNKIFSIAQDTFPECDICHYVYPHCKTKELLNGIKNKIQDFTMNDICVILIGENDFRSQNDNYNLILHLRESLENILNTNIILCVPTFNCGDFSAIFNGRIEHFNSLLYLDYLTYKYAYVLDSNLNLTYDFTMFHRRTGKINNYGMRVIFQDLCNLINNIPAYRIKNIEKRSKKNGQIEKTKEVHFFRG